MSKTPIIYEPGYIQAFGIVLLILCILILTMSIVQNKKYFYYYIPSIILIILYIIYEAVHMWFIDDTGETDRMLSSAFQLPQWTIMAFAYIFLLLANQMLIIRRINKKR